MKLFFVIDAMPRDFVYDESFKFERLSQEYNLRRNWRVGKDIWFRTLNLQEQEKCQ